MKLTRWLTVFITPALLPGLLLAKTNRDSLHTTKKIIYEKQGGNFSFGMRNTYSLFGEHTPGSFGSGAGGQFRLQLLDRLNTEWFGDVLTTNIQNKAHRTDYHIGWSVMYYLIDPRGFNRKFTPYLIAGHCFDQTVIKINGPTGAKKSRFSSAVQAGIGCHYNITPKFDITFITQYMLHIGKEIHTHENSEGVMEIEEHKNAGWQGHLLITIGVNYKFLQLWKPKK